MWKSALQSFLDPIRSLLTREGIERASAVLALVIGFRLVDLLLRRASALPEEAYFEVFPLLAALNHPSTWIVVAVQAALLASKPARTWDFGESVLGGRAGFRFVFGAMVVILAWFYSAYAPNPYYGQGHLVERGLLVACAGLVLWRPAFVLFFLLLVHVIAGQFAYPLSGYSLAQPFLLVRCLTLLAVFLALRSVWRRMDANVLGAALLAIVATAYWINGIQKIRMDWLSLAEPVYLLFSSYTTGWLSGVGEETLASWGRWLSGFSTPMKVGTVLIECGVIVFAWRRSLFLLSLAGVMVFHLSVFLLTGIAFWMWVGFELILFGWVLLRSDPERWRRFAVQYGLIVVVLTVAGQRLFVPTMLSWFDTRMSYTYRFDAISENGERHLLGPLFFQPYDYPFTVGAFGYLSEEKTLPIVWGATHRPEIAAALRNVTTPEEAFELEQRFGSSSFSAARSEVMDRFLRRFIEGKAWNSKSSWGRFFPPLLPQLWTLNDASSQCDLDTVERIEIVQLVSFFDGTDYHRIREKTLRTIELNDVEAVSTPLR